VSSWSSHPILLLESVGELGPAVGTTPALLMLEEHLAKLHEWSLSIEHKSPSNLGCAASSLMVSSTLGFLAGRGKLVSVARSW
jgi:hypothetical protein